MSHDTATAKRELRHRIRAARRERAAAGQAEADAELFARDEAVAVLSGAPALGAYLAMPGEPDPRVLLAQWSLRHGAPHVLFPRVASVAERTLEWVRNPVTVAERAAPPRVPEPVGAALTGGVWTEAKTLIVPGLAVDEQGLRLGQGGGFYDAVLADAPSDAVVIMLAHDTEVLAAGSVPAEPHDARVSVILTPTRIIDLRTPAA